MSGPLIRIALTGNREGYVIAAIPPPGQEHLPPSQQTRGWTTLVTGDVRRISADGEPEKWRAWLWPQAGGALPVTRSCDAADAGSIGALLGKLRKRAGKEPWWT